MMYASKTPRDLPEREFEGNTFFPAQHNEPNPILVVSRDEGADYWLEQVEYYGDTLSGGWIGDMKLLPAHIDHARRVLSRLAVLS